MADNCPLDIGFNGFPGLSGKRGFADEDSGKTQWDTAIRFSLAPDLGFGEPGGSPAIHADDRRGIVSDFSRFSSGRADGSVWQIHFFHATGI